MTSGNQVTADGFVPGAGEGQAFWSPDSVAVQGRPRPARDAGAVMRVSGGAKAIHDDPPVKARAVPRLLKGVYGASTASERYAFSWRCLEAA